MVANVPNREVEGVILVLAGCNGNCCFVAPKYDGNEDRSVRVNVGRNEVLIMVGSITTNRGRKVHAHTAPKPSPQT